MPLKIDSRAHLSVWMLNAELLEMTKALKWTIHIFLAVTLISRARCTFFTSYVGRPVAKALKNIFELTLLMQVMVAMVMSVSLTSQMWSLWMQRKSAHKPRHLLHYVNIVRWKIVAVVSERDTNQKKNLHKTVKRPWLRITKVVFH